jgi:hypothetical protein
MAKRQVRPSNKFNFFFEFSPGEVPHLNYIEKKGQNPRWFTAEGRRDKLKIDIVGLSKEKRASCA